MTAIVGEALGAARATSPRRAGRRGAPRPKLTKRGRAEARAFWLFISPWIIGFVGFLLGPDARYLCGSLIVVDGGTDALLRADSVPVPMEDLPPGFLDA